MVRQRQFLDVVVESEAHRRFDQATAHLRPMPEMVPLAEARGRVLFADVRALVDVPGFDRANVDGFAVRAADTFGAQELDPIRLRVSPIALAAGAAPPAGFEVEPGTAVQIATGGVIPRGADAVVMVEDTEPAGGGIAVSRSSVPGGLITFAGSDIGRGDVVLLRGQLLTSRETGVLAAVGVDTVEVVRRPRVAVVSTGDEIIAPGAPMEVGRVYDSNQRILLDAVAELGCEPVACGIMPDDAQRLETLLRELVAGDDPADVVLLSGGTSKGEGDLNSSVVERLAASLPDSPGVVVHGVALKPGKPILLSVLGGRPVVVLPGFPTSAIFTFHEFVSPLLRRLSGLRSEEIGMLEAIAPFRITSVPGRTEYSLVDLVDGERGMSAYPLGAGSGSVTAFARGDGFIRIPDTTEYVDEGERVTVRLINRHIRPADLVVIGSHCVGLDELLGDLADQGFDVKAIPVGSTAGLSALARGEGDVAGTHLMDGDGVYNTPFLPEGVRLVRGYGRRQGIAYRRGEGTGADDPAEFIRLAVESGLRMVNRNPGSGTRVLIDRLLGGERPDGYMHQPRTHHAVAAAVAQGRADWGMTLDTVAAEAGLEFLFVQDERYDLAIRADRWDRPAVAALRGLLEDPQIRARLRGLGFTD